MILAYLSAALIASGAATAADWPQYRGPARAGTSAETGILRTFPPEGPKVLWKAPLGSGYSGIAVSGGRAFTMYGAGEDEILAAFDAGTGQALWKIRIDGIFTSSQGDGPRATPTVDGRTVYAVGAAGVVVAAGVDGKEIWRVDLKEAVSAKTPRWGVSTSPLVEGDLLVLDAGGGDGKSIAALDTKTGKVAWASHSDGPGYSSPIAATIQGVRQIIAFPGSTLVALAPADGKVLWSLPWKTSWDVNAAMPVFIPPDRVFISSSYDTGAAVYRLAKEEGGAFKGEEVWRSRVMKNHFNSSVLYGGQLYGFDDKTLKCIDAGTGEERWRQGGFSKGSLLVADGRLVILSEDGLLALAEATPDAYKELARSQVLQGRTWTMPSLAGGILYLRNPKELIALAFKD